MGKSNKRMLSRTERIQLKTEKQQRELALQKALIQHNTLKKPISGWIKQLPTTKAPSQPIDGIPLLAIAGLYHQIAKKDGAKQKAFHDLLLHLEKEHCYKLLSDEQYLKGLFHIAHFAHYFIRDIAQWNKGSYQPEKQFAHLLRHLFANYPVPLFLNNAWLMEGAEKEQQWFIAIASGISVRKLHGLPIVLTKRMAHAFLWTPPYFSITGAFRFAQVIALGGDEWLAWHFTATLLGRNNFRDDDFWITVIRFFAQASLFDVRRLDEVVDYIHHRKVADAGYSMKGRTPDSLMRQVNEWQVQMRHEHTLSGKLTWPSSGIAAWEHETGTGQEAKIYKIRELTSSSDLRAEGKAMRHCVYTYVRSCHLRACAIFSLMADTFSASERLVTIEVDLKKRKIVQAKARCNAAPSTDAMEVIKLWAEKEKLSMANYLVN